MTVKIKVENFQSIQSVDVEVTGFTVVTGPNNVGKSALLRAVRGVFENTGGTSFIRDGKDRSKVELDFGEGCKVLWEKGRKAKDRPSYTLNDSDPVYPGSSVPDEVQELGVQAIQAGGHELWPTIAPQFVGQVFLLDKPGSVMAEAVADVERVGALNGALRRAESDRRTAASTLKVRKADAVGLASELQAFDGLDEIAEGVRGLEASGERLDKITKVLSDLRGLSSKRALAKREVEGLSQVGLLSVPDVEGVNALRNQLEDAWVLQRRLDKAREVKSSLTGVETVGSDLVVPDVQGLQEGIRGLRHTLSNREDILSQMSRLEDDLVEALRELENVREEVDALVYEMGGCPACGQTSKGDHSC